MSTIETTQKLAIMDLTDQSILESTTKEAFLIIKNDMYDKILSTEFLNKINEYYITTQGEYILFFQKN